MISRRQSFIPLAMTVAAPTLAIAGPNSTRPSAPASARLPDRYDEPLGIGLEGWPYPAPVHWRPCTLGGQNLRMAYMDIPPTGQKRYKVVVLLHGRNFDSSYWTGPISDLTQAGFRVIVPDQIGFHKSSKPDVSYSLDILAELTINLLSGLQIGEASFIGHSAGGMLAVRLAATYPKRVERLILEDPVGLTDYRRYIPPQSIETLVAAERRRTVPAYRALLRESLPVLPAKEMEPFVEWRMRIAQSGEYERFCRASALTTDMIYRESIRDQFDDIPAPTLMIIGEKDKTVPLIHYAAPEMAAKMPSVQQAAANAVKEMQKGSLFVVPGVGHVPHLEAADIFREKMLAFLLA